MQLSPRLRYPTDNRLRAGRKDRPCDYEFYYYPIQCPIEPDQVLFFLP